jgi:YVTN family beta-propeller protein
VTKAIDTDGTTHWIGILPNGSKIYATNKNDPFVTVVNLKTGTVATKIRGARRHRGIAVSPDASASS